MIEYILAFIALVTIYDHINFFLIKRRVKGRVKIQKGREPIFLRGKKKCGVLLLHGFSSSPGELKDLAKFLHSKSFTVYAPLLPGHGTTPAMLAMTKWQQWVSATEEAVDRLLDDCSEVWIVGNSMGGNLALITANYRKKVKGIITVSTPIVFNTKQNLVRLVLPLMKRVKFFQKKKYSERFVKRFGKTKRDDSYNMIPLRGLVHLIRVVKESKKAVSVIKKPLLVCQANPDDIMDISSAEFIYNTAKSKKKKLLWVPNSIHLVLLDPLHKKKVYKRIEGFIKDGR